MEFSPLKSSLFEVVKAGDLAAVQALLQDHPELIRAATEHGESLILLALYSGHRRIARLLLEKAADLTLFEAAAMGEQAAVEKQLRASPDSLRAYSKDGWTALHLACFFGYPGIATYLLQLGADPDAVSRNQMAVTPLHSALAAGHQDLACVLIEAGADVNAVNSTGWTPLHYAAATGAADIVRRLIQAGARKEAKNQSGQTATDVAKVKGHLIIAEILCDD